MADTETEEGDLLRIKDLVEKTGLSRQVIHQYTMMGLISVAERTKGGHRRYPPDTIELLELITGWNNTGYQLQDIKEMFIPRYLKNLAEGR